LTAESPIAVLLKEKRVFNPTSEWIEQSNIKNWMNKHNIKNYDELIEKSRDIEWFWGEVAKEFVDKRRRSD